MDSCCHEPAPGKGPARVPFQLIFWTVLAVLLLGSFFVPSLAPFRRNLEMYVRQIWVAVLAGLLLGGVLEYLVPREYVSAMLAGKKKRTVLYSVFLGFLMSACSHGILALAVQLHKKGASTAVVVSFLLASPWANLPITLLLFGLFGPKMLFILFGALGIACVTGWIFQRLEKKGLVETNPRTLQSVEGFSVVADARRRWAGHRFSFAGIGRDLRGVAAGAASLARMTLSWIFLGVVLSSFAAAFIPEGFFRRYMGRSVAGLLATLALATVVEVCSEGTAPLAFEIYKQTGAFGNAFVFLMAGVATDYTEIALLWANVGKKTALWLPVVTVPQVLVLGFVANRVF